MSEITSAMSQQIVAVVIDSELIHVLSPLNEVDALALQGCAAEDPATWSDVALVWPRYRFHEENAEFADALPVRLAGLDEAISSLEGARAWFALDLVQRRVLTGGDFPRLRLRGEPIDEQDAAASTTVLPPWWELRQRVDPKMLSGKRETPLRIPAPRRDVLWGSAMTDFFAERMLAAIRDGQEWIGENWEGRPAGRYALTVEIHRDWLMTPRDDLEGAIPRDSLHGGMEWIDDLAAGQTFRVNQGEAPVPVSTELSTYPQAAMGRHEVILYFEACRETIDAGWSWLLEDEGRIDDPEAARNLAGAMRRFLAQWLESPFEEGETPAEIVRCDRTRIPLISDGAGHGGDCDCPICEMISTGMFGPSIEHFDGHALELDDEFAFSMCATREEWEAQDREWEAMNDRIETDQDVDDDVGDATEDPFSSVWPSGAISEEGFPNDPFEHLSLAFLVADLVGSLQSVGAQQEDIDILNAAFRDYRTAGPPKELATSAAGFKHTLELLAVKHEDLVGRAADLQSRIDEQLRTRWEDGPDNV